MQATGLRSSTDTTIDGRIYCGVYPIRIILDGYIFSHYNYLAYEIIVYEIVVCEMIVCEM